MLKRNDDQLRVLLYSHDTVGLGHLRRNQAIATALAKSLPNPAILMVSGAWQGTMFDLPKCIDMVTIPAIMKAAHGGYVTRNSGLQTCDTMNLRSEIIRSVAESFQPDVFIVDKVPRGVYGELESSLESLRRRGRTLCVLGLRDVLDEPEAVQMEWLRDQNEQAIARYYDAIWVYGDRQVFDLADEYHFESTTRDKLIYTGYLDRRCGQESEAHPAGDSCLLGEESRQLHVCMVGGGEDGAPLASASTCRAVVHPRQRERH